jgi:hypothetical protein
MEHPLITGIENLNEDELLAKVNDLYKKLGIAQRTGNGHLCNQLRMALETFQNRYQTVSQENYKKAVGDNDFSDKINIS